MGHPLLRENPMYSQSGYIKGKNTSNKSIKLKNAGSISSYIRDVVRTIIVCFSADTLDYLYIGVNPLNACVGIILRKLGKVKYVIFYAIDFSPTRSSNALIDYIYHSLERIAVRYADLCWNVSPRIEEGREEFLGLQTAKGKQVVLPIGIWEKDIVRKIKAKNDYRLVFVGHLLEKQGVQEVIRALPAVLKKFPKISLTIIGGGEYEQPLRELVKSLSLEKHIQFMGWQSDQAVIQREIIKSDIAFATYMPSGKDTTNFSYYADPTKIKTYLSCGIPVVMTDVSYNAKELERQGVAVVVPYTSEAISLHIIKLFQDTILLRQMKIKSIQYAQNYCWDRIFTKAFASL